MCSICQCDRAITVDKNPAYPSASKSMKKAGELSRFARLRQVKYLSLP